jgi:hypothetical protein
MMFLAVQLARARFCSIADSSSRENLSKHLLLFRKMCKKLALGPDAIMRSANPQGIRRVPLELPPGVFTESSVLERETTSRFSLSRSSQW